MNPILMIQMRGTKTRALANSNGPEKNNAHNQHGELRTRSTEATNKTSRCPLEKTRSFGATDRASNRPTFGIVAAWFILMCSFPFEELLYCSLKCSKVSRTS